MMNRIFGKGLRNLHDPLYDTFDKLVVDEKSLPPILPAIVDYSESGFFPAINDQGEIGDCTAASAVKLFEFYHAKRRGLRETVSLRALFAAGRALYEPGDMQDDGANCSDMLNILTQYYVNESDYPSVPNSQSDFSNFLKVAPKDLWKTDFLLKSFATVNPDVENMKKAIYCKGLLQIGIAYANEWMQTESNGCLPIPQTVDGGHAIVIVGFNNTIECPDGTKGAFKIAQSWGVSFGLNGYCYLPYSYAEIQNGQFWPDDIFTIVA